MRSLKKTDQRENEQEGSINFALRLLIFGAVSMVVIGVAPSKAEATAAAWLARLSRDIRQGIKIYPYDMAAS